MDKLEARVSRETKALALMNDPVMKEAREHIDAELYRLFKETKPTDFEALSQISGMQYMHTKYLAFLNQCLTDGKMARIEIEHKKKSLKDRIFG
jgi:hypothetical protein